MTAADFAPILQSLMAGCGVVITALIGIFVPKGIAAFERRTGVAVTDQERTAVMGAVTTAAGLLQTKLDQGILHVSDVTPGSPAVVAEAQAALSRVPNSAINQGVTREAAATMIAARVDTSAKPVL